MKFNKNLLNDLYDILPKSILKLKLNFQDTNGFMRFDDDSFNSIYVRCDELNNCTSTILKFSYINNTFIFKYIYLMYTQEVTDSTNPMSIINPNYDIMKEFRYDSNLKLIDVYNHISMKKYNTVEKKLNAPHIFDYQNNKKLICEKDGSMYWLNQNKKQFKNYFNFLKSNNFIDNAFGIDKCEYLQRDEKNVFYLSIK